MQQRGETTIQDIANHARVSKSTVSRVLNKSTPVNEDKRTAVLEAMQTLGFEPNLVARSLAGGRSMTLGVLTQNIGSPFYDALAKGVIRGLAGSGYSPLFVDGQWQQSNEMESIRTLIGRRVDGLLLIGGNVPVDQLNELRQTLPTIVVGRELVGWENQCIHVDNVQAGYAATKHLISHGHERIALLRGIKEHPDAIQRFEGYVKAIEEAGIGFDSDLIYQGDFSGQSGVMAVNSLISKSIHFTAIFAANDIVAFGARLALSRHGLRVPEDISLIGFDDQAEAAFATPPLTTMKQPAVEMGEAAAQSLVKLIDNEEYELACIPVELQIRESVARLR